MTRKSTKVSDSDELEIFCNLDQKNRKKFLDLIGVKSIFHNSAFDFFSMSYSLDAMPSKRKRPIFFDKIFYSKKWV